ncbi:LutC/YkgG family protein [Arcanobacterium hippocoleae]|uniref:L-lactate dehydrogenase complex protein LldG n=1 Tax=Arcanobacterium hippocoleae TaxID=149017 RepID=A0ABU1T0Y3_9ACTO|nr:lactate utilization protein C [Arcanobacterium hippocoleae]MDR6938966.1 L-lactate dehydrogenase complex protein LldG [Arcanobacterium hippocoleae]
MDAKTEIFNRIRDALQLSQNAPAPEIPRNYRMEGEFAPGSAEVIAEMREKLEDYKAIVIETDESGLPQAITAALADVKSVVVPHGLNQKWIAAAKESGAKLSIDNPETGEILSHSELDAIQTVLTASRCGVSLSGTIMLDGEPDQGRRAITLVPDQHVLVLAAKEIYAVVPQAVAKLGAHPTRPTTWIAGPSATSDIELKRVDGVHGPRKLTVIIVR